MLEFYQDTSKRWRWRIIAANAKIIVDCGEGYKRKKDCQDAAKAVALVLLDNLVRMAK